MKIIFVMVNMAGGGAERVISILANRFVKLGNQVAILMTAGERLPMNWILQLNCSVREACPAEV